MVEEIFLQNEVFTRYIYPFLLIWVIMYAILEKTKIIGENQHKANALISLLMGLIFVTVFSYVFIIDKLVLFLIIAIIIIFVAMLLWGFITGSVQIPTSNTMKWVVGLGIVVAVTIATFWATGVSDNLINFFFEQEWSGTFWTNFLFIGVIAIALALILRSAKGGGGGSP